MFRAESRERQLSVGKAILSTAVISISFLGVLHILSLATREATLYKNMILYISKQNKNGFVVC